MTGFSWQAVAVALGALYATSLPFSGWLVLEAHRIRKAALQSSQD